MDLHSYGSRREWLAARTDVIGGSDVPIILGTLPSTWATPFSLWARKVGLAPDIETTERMEWGSRLEEIILTVWGADPNIELDVEHVDNAHVQHPDFPEFKYSPDGFVISEHTGERIALIEIKNVDRHSASHWSEGGPDYYQDQVQFGLHCCGLEVAYLVALIGGNELVYEEVARSDEWAAKNFDTLIEFHRLVMDEIPPPVDGNEPTHAALSYVNGPGTNDDEVELPVAFVEDVDRLRDIEAQIKKLGTDRRKIRAAIAVEMGENRRGLLAGREEFGYFLYSTVKRRGYTVEPSEQRILRWVPRGKRKKE